MSATCLWYVLHFEISSISRSHMGTYTHNPMGRLHVLAVGAEDQPQVIEDVAAVNGVLRAV